MKKQEDKLYLELPWEEFVDRYINNHEEFRFWYKEYEINLSYGLKGKFAYCIMINKKMIDYNEFNSPDKLLDNMLVDGKRLIQIWKELY